MKIDFNQILVIAFCVLFVSFSSADFQDNDLKDKADSFFKNEEYLKALPLYSQLLSLKPTDAELNFKYGACLIFKDGDTDEPIKYLKFATENNAPVEAYYFLGKAFHLNYQFKDAIDAYSEFLSDADNKLKDKYQDTQRQIEMCAFGSNLLNNIKEIYVLDKTVTADVEFFRNYDLTDVGGRILVTPDELLSTNDKRFNHRSLIHFPGESSKLYFASYGKEDHTDIYTSTIMADGSFSKPVKVGGQINTPYNEDFPFLHPDGRTLYFSSQGHNSMGGFDIFKSELSGNNQFGKPVNLDFAINSPDDDIFYIADANNKLAYFASGRSSGEGDIHVYKVMVESRPLNMAVIKGQFKSEISADLYDASVYVQDATTNAEVGKFYTNKESGEYVIVLPKSGRYKFFVEAPESKYTHSGMVEIPPSENIRAFKQTMDLVEVNEKEKLIIKNLFEEQLEEDIMALVQQVIKERARLDVNADESDLEEVALNDFGSIYEQAGFQQNTTKAEVVDALVSKENELDEIISEQREIASKSKNLSLNKKSESETKLVKAEELFGKMKAATDQREKERLLIQAAKNKGESMELADEAIVAMELSEFMSSESARNDLMVKGFKQGNKELINALDEESGETLVKLKEQKQFMDETTIDAPEDQLAREAAEERNRTEKILNRATDLSDELNVLEKRLESKVRSLEKSKKEKDRIQIGNEIQVLEDEIELVERDKNQAFEELAEKQRNANVLEGSQELVQNLDEGEVEVKGDVYISIDQLDKDIAEIIKRNDDIEISEVEIQEILINRPSLVGEFFTTERELVAFKRTFHLPEYISLDETVSGLNEHSSDVATVEDINISDTATEDELIPEELALKTELLEFDVAQQIIYPDIDDEINDVIFSGASSTEKSGRITEIRNQFDENVEQARMALFTLRDEGEINDEVFEKNAAFLDELGSSKLNEINKIIAAYEPKVRKEVAVDFNSANTTHDLYNTAGVSKEEIELKKRLTEINNSSNSAQEEAERSIVAREEYIKILNNKINQNNINIQYAPSREMESQLKKQNAALEEIIDLKSAEIENYRSFLDVASNEQDGNKSDLNDFSSFSLTIDTENDENELRNNEEGQTSSDSGLGFESEVESLSPAMAIQEARDDEYFNDLNRLSASPREYQSAKASQSFQDQSMLYREVEYMREVDLGAAVEKEIAIITKAEVANKLEFEHFIASAKNTGISEDDERIENAKKSFATARTLRDTAEVIADNNEKLYFLKHAYGYELKGIESLENEFNLSSENLAVAEKSEDSKFQTTSINDEVQKVDEETYFKSQANLYKVETNKEIEPAILDVLIDPAKRDIEDILIRDLGYSESEMQEIRNDDEKLAENLKMWKVAQIDKEITTQRDYINTYQDQYDLKTQSYKDIQSILAETNDPIEKEQLKSSTADLLAEADVLDYYRKVAEQNISTLEVKRNDVSNGELEFAEISEDQQYLELSDFVDRYFEGDNPFDLLNIPDETNESEVSQVDENSGESKDVELKDSIIEVDQPNTKEVELTEEEVANQKVAELQRRLADELKALNPDEFSHDRAPEVEENNDIVDEELSDSESVNTQSEMEVDELANISTQDKFTEEPFEEPITTEEDVINEQPLESEVSNSENVVAEMQTAEDPMVIEFEEGVDRDSKLIIVDGSDEIYQFKEGDVRGLENNLTYEPFNPYEFEVPVNLEDEVYFLSEEDVVAYENVPNGIPLDVELPEGLIFQVQIGAFYRPVAPEVFKGYAPINGERSRTGLIRYRAGMFKIFDTANKAKNEIRAKGYSDAFVVAFYNGERIPLYIGRSMLDQQTVEKYNYAQRADRDKEAKTSGDISSGQDTTSKQVETVDVNQDFAPVTPVKELKGLFYTVQVGVYSKQVSAEDLYHVTPLTSETTSNNKIRYTSGIFNEFGLANQWKTEVQNLGISDAFVSAYYNGERISLREARSYSTDQVVSQDDIVTPVPNQVDRNIEPEAISKPTENMTEDEIWQAFNALMEEQNKAIRYKLRFGPYEDEIPMEEANLILDFKNDITFSTDASGAFMYTTNQAISYPEIIELKEIVRGPFITNLHIIGIEGDNEIDYLQAKSQLEN